MENMTLEQLKAAAYDRIAMMERAKGELEALNREIVKRMQPKEPEAVKE
jgi:hypothetical protein